MGKGGPKILKMWLRNIWMVPYVEEGGSGGPKNPKICLSNTWMVPIGTFRLSLCSNFCQAKSETKRRKWSYGSLFLRRDFNFCRYTSSMFLFFHDALYFCLLWIFKLQLLSSKTQKMHFSPVLGLMSDSLTTISVESHLCPLNQFILLTQGPILLNVFKKYWELTVLKNLVFLSWPF